MTSYERKGRKFYQTHRTRLLQACAKYRASEYGKVQIARRVAVRRSFLDRWKLAAGCIDCGYAGHPAALDFDHIDPAAKSFGLSTANGRSLRAIVAEVAKCVVRCANCHRIKTHS